MALKYGLKLWSINHNLFPQAVELCQNGQVDFVEMYIVPGQVDLQVLAPFQNVTTFVHAPHENHGFNVFKLDADMKTVWRRDVLPTVEFLRSPLIVLHAGAGERNEDFRHNLRDIDDPRIIIENMPVHGIHGEYCYGHSFDQLQFLTQKLGKPLCMDIGHTIKSAVAQKLNYQEFLAQVLTLGPTYFHISDGDTANPVDEHLDLGAGTFDLKWIKEELLKRSAGQDCYLTFEVPKKGYDLQNDLDNIARFKAL